MIISAPEYLARFSATQDQAFKFVVEHISQPELIHQVCKATGITTSLLTQIVQSGLPGVSPTQVRAYFTRAGLDPLALDMPDFDALKASFAANLKNLVNVDGLTGLYNHRYFYDFLSQR